VLTLPPSPPAAAAADRTAVRPIRWLALTAVLVAVKLAWLAADHTPMLFLGDSESYLTTALTGWIPPDRSFLYGFMLRALVLKPGSLLPLIVAQSACSVGAALLLAHLLASAFAVRQRVAFAVAVAWSALEPLALLYERYVMTEAFALVAFTVFVTLSIRYIAARRLRDVVLAQAAATLVIAFRTVFVPISLVFTLALPVLAWARRPPNGGAGSARRGLALALLVSITATAVSHQVYRIANGRLSDNRPAYQYADGLFLLAAWAPVLSAQDFEDRSIGEAVFARSACKPADRFSREAQRWYPGCIVDVLHRHVGNDQRANTVARGAAFRALRRDPMGIANLALATWLDNFEPERVRRALRWDRGEFPFQPSTVALLRDRLGVAQAADLHRLETPTNRWHLAAVPWVMLLALAPFIAILALAACPVDVRRNMAFVALLAACIIGASAIASTGPVPRYFHAVAWLMAIPLTVIGTRLARALLPSPAAA